MNSLVWLETSFPVLLVQTLLHFLWQGTAIMVLVFVMERLRRPLSSQSKYLVHVFALAAMVACVPITFALLESPPIELSEHQAVAERVQLEAELAGELSGFEPASAVEPEIAERSTVRASSPEDDVLTLQEALPDGEGSAPAMPPVLEPANIGEVSGVAAVESHPVSPRLRFADAAPYIAVSYLMCVLAMLVRLVCGVWGGHKLRRISVLVEDPGLLAMIGRQAKRIGLRIAPAIAYCEQISVPVLIGVARPMILLPSSLVSGLAPDQLEALVTHELAHLRRHDPLVNLFQRLVEAVLFFHPAVWYVSRRISIERENASDDLVVMAGWKPVDYADALVRMAELSMLLRNGQHTSQTAILGAAGGNASDFKRRVMRLLEPEPCNVRLTTAGLVMLLAVLVTAIVAPVVVQSDERSASSNAAETSAVGQGERLGRQITDFRLPNYLGTEQALSDLADHQLVVITFLGIECPVAKVYASRLESLAKKYRSQGVAFLGINSNQQDTPTELGHYARRHGITFPLLKDPGNRVADRFGAVRTPEVFVLDKSRVVRYWGRIDDQFGVGYAKPEPKEHYLAAAIDDLLAGREIAIPHVDSVGCHISRISREPPTGEITYSDQIARIMQRRCIECHREGGIAPFALDSYEAVAAWAETICEVIEDQRMPPWHANPNFGNFANEARMPEAEKELLYQWLENGVPEGSEDDLPPPLQFVDGWAMGRPELVIQIPEAIRVPATGVIDYQYITVDPGFTEGRWVRASEIRPGVRSVVHHIVVFIDPPGGDPILEERGIGFEMVGGYVPGSPPMELPSGVARYVPAGSRLVFQIHYTPDGVERHDQSEIGLYFADPDAVHYTMQTGVAANTDFRIPPHASNYRVEATHRFTHDMELYTLAPHMHYRGKSFRFEVTYPNGSREILLDVPRYDFNWQNAYKLAQPRFIPEGTLLRCIAHFDNSEANLSNPDPSIPVKWGEQTWDEMMIGYFEGIFLNQDLSLPEPQITPVGDGRYRVRFTFQPERTIKGVNLAGTFNDWNTSSHPLNDPDGDGIYVADVILEEGAYRYKFVIDGDYWSHDPASRILTGFLHESFFVAGPRDVH